MNSKPVAIKSLRVGDSFRFYADKRWANQWGIVERVSVGDRYTRVTYRTQSGLRSEFYSPSLASVVVR